MEIARTAYKISPIMPAAAKRAEIASAVARYDRWTAPRSHAFGHDFKLTGTMVLANYALIPNSIGSYVAIAGAVESKGMIQEIAAAIKAPAEKKGHISIGSLAARATGTFMVTGATVIGVLASIGGGINSAVAATAILLTGSVGLITLGVEKVVRLVQQWTSVRASVKQIAGLIKTDEDYMALVAECRKMSPREHNMLIKQINSRINIERASDQI